MKTHSFSAIFVLLVLIAQCCNAKSHQFENSERSGRFVMDTFLFPFQTLANAMAHYIPDFARKMLPKSVDLSALIRVDIDHLNHASRTELKQLYNSGYSICIGCGQTNDFDDCKTINICKKGSYCIKGHSDDFSTTIEFLRGHWHGCCSPTDPKCATENITMHGLGLTVDYMKEACTGILCNADPQAATPVKANSSASPQTVQLPASNPLTSSPSGPQGTTTQNQVAMTTVSVNHTSNITCMQCTGPPEVCEVYFSPGRCVLPDTVCINELRNKRDGSRTLVRRCGTMSECYRNWYMTYSDDDRCTKFDSSQAYTFDFQCSYCCTTPNCNNNVLPSHSSLYSP